MARKGKEVAFSIQGADALSKKLKRLPEVVDAAAKRAVKDETHAVAEDMRRAAPVDTGKLKKGIQERKRNKGLSGWAVSTADHTPFVVHGTSDTPRNDFMTPAAERSRRRFPKRVKAEVDAELRKVAGK